MSTPANNYSDHIIPQNIVQCILQYVKSLSDTIKKLVHENITYDESFTYWFYPLFNLVHL